jgi:hypothetical protein
MPLARLLIVHEEISIHHLANGGTFLASCASVCPVCAVLTCAPYIDLAPLIKPMCVDQADRPGAPLTYVPQLFFIFAQSFY